MKLYTFWETVEDAPREIIAIKEDLRFLISVFKRVESHGNNLGSCLAEGVQHCRAKITVSALMWGCKLRLINSGSDTHC